MLPPWLVKRFVVQYESVRLTNKCDRGCSLKTTVSAFSNGRCLSLHNRYPCFFHPIVSVVLFYSSLFDKDLASHTTPHMQRNSLSHPAGTVICGSDHAKDESEKGEMCLKSFKCMLDLTQTRSLGVMGSRRLLGRFASGERPGGRFRERHPRGHHTFPKASSEKVLAFPDSSYSILKSEVACVQT